MRLSVVDWMESGKQWDYQNNKDDKKQTVKK